MLILLSIGLLFDAATGPSRIVMMMTGHERDYVRIFGTIMVARHAGADRRDPGLRRRRRGRGQHGGPHPRPGRHRLVQPPQIGLDTSLLGLFRINRLSDQPRARRRPAKRLA